jgi:AmpE protein
MFTTLIAVIAALALGHVAPALVSALRPPGAWRELLAWLYARADIDGLWSGRYALALLVVPLVLLLLGVQWALGGVLWGLPALVFGIVMLIGCWGPRDLDVDVEAALDAADPAARQAALQRLAPEPGQPVQEGPTLAAPVMRSALRRWFAVLFWFLLLGPAGAVMYRAVERSVMAADVLPAAAADGAHSWLQWLEWPVAQLMVLTLALVGHFDQVFRSWRGNGGDGMPPQSPFLEAAARAAVSGELADQAQDLGLDSYPVLVGELPELRDVMSLVWRMLLLWLALLALLVIAGWVG